MRAGLVLVRKCSGNGSQNQNVGKSGDADVLWPIPVSEHCSTELTTPHPRPRASAEGQTIIVGGIALLPRC